MSISTTQKITNITNIILSRLDDYELNFSDVPSYIGSKTIANSEEQEITQDKVIGAWEIPASGHNFTILATRCKATNTVRYHIYDSELPVNIVRKFYPYNLSLNDHQEYNLPESEYRIKLNPNSKGNVNVPIWNIEVKPYTAPANKLIRDAIYSLLEKLA